VTKIIAQFTLVTAALLLGASLGHAQAPGSPQQAVFNLTNQDRQQLGLPVLRWNEALARAAQAHAQRMADESSLSHQYPGEPELMTRAASAGAHFSAIAENIATGPNPEAIEHQWMHSTPHRANILDPKMNALGAAVVSRRGMLYAVEDFATANEALTRSQIEARLRALLAAEHVDPSAPSGPAEQACESNGFPRGAGVRAIVRFQTPDLSHLPSQVQQQIRSGDFRRAAVGACAPTPDQADFTTCRVAILFY
jgi:hypothetical protein